MKMRFVLKNIAANPQSPPPTPPPQLASGVRTPNVSGLRSEATAVNESEEATDRDEAREDAELVTPETSQTGFVSS